MPENKDLRSQMAARRWWRAGFRWGNEERSRPELAVSAEKGYRLWTLLLAAVLVGILPLLVGCQEEAPQSPSASATPLAAPVDGELAVLRAQIEALNAELAQQREAMQRLNAAVAVQLKAVSAAVTSAVTEIDAVAVGLDAVSGTVDGLADQIATVSSSADQRFAATAATLTGLRSDVDAQQAAISSLQIDVAAAQATANDAAARAATWPAAVSAWAEGRYVQRLYSWSMGTTYKPSDGLGPGQFFAKRRYSFDQIGLDVTGPVNGRVLVDVAVTYGNLTTDETAALWLCVGGGLLYEGSWDTLGVNPGAGCTALPNEPVDDWTEPFKKDVRFTMMAPLALATSFALQVTGNPAMLRDLPKQPGPVYIWLQPIAWFPDDP